MTRFPLLDPAPRPRRPAPLRLLVACAVACVAASCAPIPPPATTTPPPIPVPEPESVPVPGTVTPKPQTFDVHDEPEIDVGVAWDLETIRLDPSRPATIRVSSPQFESVVDEAALGIEARIAEGGWEVTWTSPGGEPGSLTPDPAETLWVSVRRGDIRWNDQTWRGTFKLFGNPRGTLTAALRLPLETYLIGVVPGEIGELSEALFTAGQAQAIAARSYTLFYRGRRASEGFDVYGTVDDQLYVPVERERPMATRCVETTQGEVALYDGWPIRANYSSTCGGITSEVWEAWPADPIHYLASRRDGVRARDYCVGSTHYRWREEWPAAEFLETLRRFAPDEGVRLPRNFGDLIDVRVERRSVSGRVWELRMLTAGGEIVVPGRRLRWVLRRPGRPQSILRSNLFKIAVRRDPETRRALAVVASGAGSGHGVGLCQVGARAMSRAGISAEGILLHYYSDIEIQRLY